MGMISAYFIVYSLVNGLSLMVFFRTRQRRRFLWIVLPAIPLVCLVGIPALDQVVHTRPSFAEFVELSYFPPASREGVVVGTIRVRSSGRQKHRLDLAGDDVKAFAFRSNHSQYRRGTGAAASLGAKLSPDAAPADSGDAVFALNSPPWAARQVLFADTVQRPNPVAGKVVVDTTRWSAKLSVDFGGPVSGELMLVLVNDFPRQGGRIRYHYLRPPTEGRSFDIALDSLRESTSWQLTVPGDRATGRRFPGPPTIDSEL